MGVHTVTGKIVGRTVFVLTVFSLLWIVLGGKLFKMQIIDYEEYQGKVIEKLTTESTLTPERGDIYDTNGVLLATNKTVWRVFISPVDIQTTTNVNAIERAIYRVRYGQSVQTAASGKTQDVIIAEGLSKILGIDYDTIIEKAAKKGRLDETIAKNVEKEQADLVRAFIVENDLSNQVHLQASSIRYYCYDNLASHVLGFVGTEGAGLYGLELEYNDELTGTQGRYITAQDATGGNLPINYENYIVAKNGYHMTSTIDMRIQYELEAQLEATFEASGAKNRVCGIVMDVKTGAILASSVKPDFNLNDPYVLDVLSQAKLDESEYAEDSEEYAALKRELRLAMWNNKVVNDIYEPGSTFKIMTSAMVLEEDLVDVGEHFYCSGAHLVPGYSRPIHCHKLTGHGDVSFARGLQQSCNPVMMSIVERLGKDSFRKYFEAMGYLEKTGVDLPGEASTYFFSSMGPVELATSSFGQGFKVTALQQITSICTVANGGYLVTPHYMKEFVDDDGNVVKTYDTTPKRQVLSASTCETITKILEEGVATDGAARNAYVPGYRVAAKTGTSQKMDKPDANGEFSLRIGSCVAYAPADDPQIAVLIMVDEPSKGNSYGSVVAAPYVANVLKNVLPYLGVEPEYSETELEKLEVNIPNYRSWLVEDAVKSIGYLGIKHEIVGDGTLVKAQIPEGGSMLAKDSGKIILYTGEETPVASIKVPDVMGKTAVVANSVIINSGLNIKITGTTNYENGVGAVVVSQSPSAGETVTPGTVVTVEFRYLDGTD